jgi:hypothetical protein
MHALSEPIYRAPLGPEFAEGGYSSGHKYTPR